jgi:hypothetical protein
LKEAKVTGINQSNQCNTRWQNIFNTNFIAACKAGFLHFTGFSLGYIYLSSR